MRVGLLAAAFLSFLFANRANCDTAPQQSAPAAPTANTNQPAMAGASLINGKVTNCAANYYPALAIRLNHEGGVVINVRIDDKGNVAGTDIGQSSGWPELDDAAKQCVTAWHFIPATENGRPVESTKRYKIVWKLTGGARPWLKTDIEKQCNSVFTNANIRWPSYRATTLEFRVSSTGSVESPFVAISSGDLSFDTEAMECITKLDYAPDQVAGIPTEVSWTAAVLWSPSTGLAFDDGRDIAISCPDSAFPASLWKGNPPNPTEISFKNVFGPFSKDFAIERQSGNPELDQAALACLKTIMPEPPGSVTGSPPSGRLIRFDWHEGHAFALKIRGN